MGIVRRGRLVVAVTIGAVLAAPLATQAVARGVPDAVQPESSDPAVVVTQEGSVRGTVAAGHRSFLGIPFAAPPVGELRFASPRPARPWREVREATAPGGACPQNAGLEGVGSDNEDCLYLNVTTPTIRPGRRLPVMVWIHGGSFTNGTGAMYPAQRLATRGDVIVVTINYRLGALGFLAHPALDVAGRASSGAFGIEDQQAALGWVRRNAAAFGGDPGNVTIFGESAGGLSVCAHLTAPGSAGLFHKAIIESGPCTLPATRSGAWTLPVAEARQFGITAAEKAGCSDERTVAACLRALPVSKLLPLADQSAALWPTTGGTVLPVEPSKAISTGRFSKVPVIQGTNLDEYRLFTAVLERAAGHPMTADEYRLMITEEFGDAATKIVAKYPLSSFDSPSLAYSELMTDAVWACPALGTSSSLARHVPTWSYEFSDRNAPWLGDGLPSFPTGAYHAAELPYLFDMPPYTGQLNDRQRRLADLMIKYWARFAHTGDPVGPGAPAWRRFTERIDYTQAFVAGDGLTRRVSLDREHRCRFWASVD